MPEVVSYLDVVREVSEQLPKGIFLNVAHEGKRNTMTIGWGGIIFFCGKPYYLVPVRPSRYTFPLLQASRAFTVSIPLHDMQAETRFAGTQSGRDVDKFSGHGITAMPAQQVEAPIVAECALHLECRVHMTPVVTAADCDAQALSIAYPKGNLHTLFMGEILIAYRL